jgi:hypothetical protein
VAEAVISAHSVNAETNACGDSSLPLGSINSLTAT